MQPRWQAGGSPSRRGVPGPTLVVAVATLVVSLGACSSADDRAETADRIAGRFATTVQSVWDEENGDDWPDPAAPMLAVRDALPEIELPAGVERVELGGGGRGSGSDDAAETVFPVVVEPTQGGRYCIHVALLSDGTARGELAVDGDPQDDCRHSDSGLLRRVGELQDTDT